MINKIIGFRKRDKKESHELTLQSKTIYQFLLCDFDILALCSVLFPNIQILPNF